MIFHLYFYLFVLHITFFPFPFLSLFLFCRKYLEHMQYNVGAWRALAQLGKEKEEEGGGGGGEE